MANGNGPIAVLKDQVRQLKAGQAAYTTEADALEVASKAKRKLARDAAAEASIYEAAILKLETP